jgi:hypothetical protein
MTLLRNAYPGVDLNSCFIVHHNTVAISKSLAVWLLVAAIALVAGAVFLVKRMPPPSDSKSTAGPVSSKFVVR